LVEFFTLRLLRAGAMRQGDTVPGMGQEFSATPYPDFTVTAEQCADAVASAKKSAEEAELVLQLVLAQAVRRCTLSGLSQRQTAEVLALSKSEVNRIAKLVAAPQAGAALRNGGFADDVNKAIERAWAPQQITDESGR
jgi:predicted XRE-type DNA-binding protein